MQPLPPRLTGLLERAAELRVTGQSWEQIGRELNRTAATVRGWSTRYRDAWDRLVAAARRSSIESAADEARTFLRRHLRSDKDATSRDAAKLLINLLLIHAKLNPAELDPAQNLEQTLEGLTDDQLRELVVTVGDAYQASLAQSAPGPDVPASPA